MTVNLKLFDDLEAVAREAGASLSREKRPWLFDRLDWLRLVRDHTPPEGRLVAVQAENREASAWLFLGAQRGSAIAFSNWYCLRFGPIVSGDNAEAALDALAQGLRRAGVHRLYLSPIAGDDPLPAALRRKGWITRMTPSNTNWSVRTAGMTFEEYWASRPSKLRNTVKRRTKAAGLEIVLHDRFDEQAWSDYESVYRASWKPSEGSPELMRKLAQQEGEAGTLRLGVAYREGQPVAAQFWITEGGVATIHKLAYREDARQHSPGTILSVAMFRHAIDVDKVDLIDFGIGGDGYKAEWMTNAVPLYALTAYDPLSIRGLAGIARSAVSKLVGRLRRQ